MILQEKTGRRIIPKRLHSGCKKGAYEPKLDRIIKATLLKADRVIIMYDADGSPTLQQRARVEKFISRSNMPYVYVVILAHEIEDWICYSMDLSIGDKKPSSILKEQYGYKKFRLKDYALKVDCQRLSQCESYRSLESFLV